MNGWKDGQMDGWMDVRYRTFLVLFVFLKLLTHLFMFSPLPLSLNLRLLQDSVP